ncbi:type II toxin-antitoxin system HicA family toxin [Nesterenkonia sphaerica]|uniref:Type II toxin-antitoxin system HicA family toxin n=1 Tax=Nesterenkonia sphaerica TaxID=1804988 RepID=A0A5R9AQ21_9MICC|nr:type II toxin-antitoxin system HicA family toxin [Nesterenkonia sphaerica]TLP79946.1 type II toxin-antitoxin system HicA family toxin [Nesterenkonia sphaerica]
MPKKRDLVRRLQKAAKAQGVTFEQADRRGGRHDIYKLDGQVIPIPRHTEINEMTAEAIYKQAEVKLGKRWWK